MRMETVAQFTNLEDAEVSQNCPVLELEGPKIHLKLPNHVAIGKPVKIEANDTLSLGEVVYCRPAADGYVVCVEVMEALHNVTELSRLARALLG